MNLAAKILVGMLTLVLAGCFGTAQTVPDPVISYQTKVVDTSCASMKVITVTRDRLTDASAKLIIDQINASQASPKKALVDGITATNQDWLTPETTQEILAHDRTYAANCKK